MTSCGKKSVPEASPPPVTFATAKAENVPLTIDTFGNCVTIGDVTLQAQVEGTLLRYAVAEGAMVKKGDLVAEIDPAPYRTPDTVELDWSQRGENEPQVGAWKEGLGGREFLAEMNQHGIVGRRAQAMEPHV